MTHSLILEATKKDIRSLLLPNKDGLILKGLQEEHQAVLGCAIPSRKLGFSSDLDFLKSIPDVVEIISLPDKINFLCKAVADPNVDHIRRLVAKQRSNIAGYHKRTKHVLDRQKFFQSDSGIRNQASTLNTGINSWEGHFQFMPNKNVYGASRGNGNRLRKTSSFNSKAPLQFHRKVDTTFKKDCLAIVEKFPDGIDIAEFEVMYLKHTSSNLNFRRFGFTSLLECLSSIPDILQFRKKGNKNELREFIFSSFYAEQYDISQGIKERSTIPVMKLTRPYKESSNSSSSSDSYDSCQQEPYDQNDGNHEVSLIKQIENYVPKSEEITQMIKLNLSKLIAMYPKGLEITSLSSVYQLEFGEELNPMELGCTSIDEMCITLNGIFLCERSREYRNSWILFPVPLSESPSYNPVKYSEEELALVADNIQQLFDHQHVETLTRGNLSDMYMSAYKKALNLKRIGMSMDELLNFLVQKDIIELSIKAEDPFKPTAVNQELIISRKKSSTKIKTNNLQNKTLSIAKMRLRSLQDQLGGESIPVQEVPKHCVIDSTLEIIMGEIWSPTKFWILLKEYYDKLNELGREMTEFYGDRNTEHLMLPESHVVSGQVCAVREGEDERGDWYRSIIVNVVDTSTVTVQDIDYGQRRKAKIDSIRFLRRDFAESLNAQAIPSKLANVIPTNNHKNWDKRACKYFAEIATESKDDGLFGIIKGLHHGLCRKLSLLLYDTATNNLENGIYINQELVNQGMADIDVNADENEGYELPLSKNLIDFNEEKLKQKPVAPLRLPKMATLLAANASSGYGTGPPLSPSSTGGPSNLKNDWMSNFLPQPSSQQPKVETNGNCNGHFSALWKDSNILSLKNLTCSEDLKRCISSSNLTSNGKEIVCALSLPNGNTLHTINIENCRYVISAEISSLFPRWKNKDVLEQMLELKKIIIPKLVFTQEKDQNLFQELILAEVKGLTTVEESLVKRVVLYPLEYIPEMLRLFHGRDDAVVEDLIRAIKSEL